MIFADDVMVPVACPMCGGAFARDDDHVSSLAIEERSPIFLTHMNRRHGRIVLRDLNS